MKKCLIWGNGADYEIIINQILFEIEKNNIEVIGIVAKTEDIIGEKYDGFNMIEKEYVTNIDFDYIIVTSSQYFSEIRKEILDKGIDSRKIINGQAFKIPHFDFERYSRLIENPITIFSNDCWGGCVYKSLFLPFNSPLINILWEQKDYIKFICNWKKYVDLPLNFERESNWHKLIHPIGSLGQGDEKVFLNFTHALNFEHAKNDWIRRCKRINPHNLFIKLGFNVDEINADTEDILQTFNLINERKVCLYPHSIQNKNTVFLNRYDWSLLNMYRKEGHLAYVTYRAYCMHIKEMSKSVDFLKLLNGIEDYMRE